MKRRSFDSILSLGGVVLTVVLLVAGGVLMWGYTFANGQVHNQLAREQIFVPKAGSTALADPRVGPYLDQYAGQQVVNGAQAEAYADHFIAVHLTKVAGGLTYSQASAKAQAAPTNTKLAAEVQTLFRGETLRGLLLNAYAFWKFGQIALVAAICSFVLAAVMLVLSAMGFVHLRRTESEEEIFGSTNPLRELVNVR